MLYYINSEILLMLLPLLLLFLSVCFEIKLKNTLVYFCLPIVISLFVLLLMSGVLVLQLFAFMDLKVLLFFDQYVIDSYAIFSKLFLVSVMSLVLVLLQVYLVRYKQRVNEYLLLMLFSFIGLYLMVGAYDFLFLYIVIELQALSSYALAGLRTQSRLSVEAGIKYFITGTVASSLFLLGVLLLYAVSGTTNFSALALFFLSSANNSFDPIVALGLFFLTFGLLFKLGAAPFHMWLLDVYQGSPLPVTVFFATLPKIALIILMIRLYYEIISPFVIKVFILDELFRFPFYGLYGAQTFNFLFLAGLFSVFVGALGGLVQVNIKRLFAYSSINNVGFILLGLSLSTVEALHAVLFYLVVYIYLIVNFFSILMLVRYFSVKSIIVLNDLRGLGAVFALGFAFSLFSLAGVPPFAGFFSKAYIYYALIESGHIYAAGFVAFVSILSAFFYIRIIAILFFEGLGSTMWDNFFCSLKTMRLSTPMLTEVFLLTAGFNIFFCFFVGYVSDVVFTILFYLFS